SRASGAENARERLQVRCFVEPQDACREFGGIGDRVRREADEFRHERVARNRIFGLAHGELRASGANASVAQANSGRRRPAPPLRTPSRICSTSVGAIWCRCASSRTQSIQPWLYRQQAYGLIETRMTWSGSPRSASNRSGSGASEYACSTPRRPPKTVRGPL